MIWGGTGKVRPRVAVTGLFGVIITTALLVGVVVSLLSTSTIIGAEVIGSAGLGGFIAFHCLVKDELTILQGLGAYLVALASLTATFNGVRGVPIGGLASATISDLLLAAAAVALGLSILTQRYHWPMYPPVIALAAAALVLSAVLTSLVAVGPVVFQVGGAVAPQDGRPAAALFLGGVILTPLVLATGTSSKTPLILSTWLWLFSGACNGIVVAINSLGITQLGPQLTGYGFAGRAWGLTNHVNSLGLACAMLVPVGASLVVSSKATFLRLIAGAATLAAAYGMLQSGSRGATVAGVLGLAILPILTTRRFLLAGLGSLSALVLVGAVYYVAGSMFSTVQRITGQLPNASASDAIHFRAWSQSLEHGVGSPLFGNGYQYIDVAHDLALQVFESGGALGVASYALFVGGFLFIGLRLRSDSRLPLALQRLSAALVASIIVFLANGAVANQIYDRYLYWPFGLLLAVYYLANRQPSGTPHAEVPHMAVHQRSTGAQNVSV